MKKLTKSIVSLALVVVMLVCFCGTALAAATDWGLYFPLLQQGTQSTYNYGLQAILYRYNDTTQGYIVDAGGVDGSFGPGTHEAVKSFQVAQRLAPDGLVGVNTWDRLYFSLQYINGLVGYSFYRVVNRDGGVYVNQPAVCRYSLDGDTAWYAYRDTGSRVWFSGH